MSVPQNPAAPKVEAEKKVDTKSPAASNVRKKRSDKIGYDKKNAFKKTVNGKEIITPTLLRRPSETEEQFQKRMELGGWLGPDKPKGHWAPDNPLVYHMGATPQDCPYCSGRREITARKKKSASNGGNGIQLKVARLGTATPTKDGGRIYFFFNQADFIKISKAEASGLTVVIASQSKPKAASERSSVPPAKPTNKQEKKEPVVETSKAEIAKAVAAGAKPEIQGGHSDVNRSLKDRGLPEIYKDSDESKHKKNPKVTPPDDKLSAAIKDAKSK